MTTFPLLDETTAPDGSLDALATTKKNFGMNPNVEKVVALAPPLLPGHAHMHTSTTYGFRAMTSFAFGAA